MPSTTETSFIALLKGNEGSLYNLSSLNALADSLILNQQRPVLARATGSLGELLASAMRLDALLLTSSSFEAKKNELFALSDLTKAFAEQYSKSYSQSLLSSDLARSAISIVEFAMSKVSELRSLPADQRIEDNAMVKNSALPTTYVPQNNAAVIIASEYANRRQSFAPTTKRQSTEARRQELEQSKKKQKEPKQGGIFQSLRALLRKIFKKE